MNGDAIGTTLPGQFRDHIFDICNKTANANGGEGQIRHAMMKQKGVTQCPTCFIYLTKKNVTKHIKLAQCKYEDKYNFNKIQNKDIPKPSFYCYFGCSFWEKRDELVDHLVMNHTKANLKAWGVNKDLLARFYNQLRRMREYKLSCKSHDKKKMRGKVYGEKVSLSS